ncbi:hypothetical protein ACIODS_17175 [Micromonospora chalcea]|jgi:hypothetical protein|uniref:Uncharacterized protein n=1 Tax=Micromonospora aurantiaca (nom. illeg.) TaxID=47850 RepID=A0A3M9JXI8_9ACTN|nr:MULTISPECIES: hypothetical protein [Micromonospora]AXH93691.1 hypothetical protein DVH21_29390 [Micromonospora aurantiaca]KAB1116587.1 hypothetical protein F6X54_11150 [Micromonospora aurantiaca]MBC9002324.1 hypothetical protein [Micromonospora aurantiaca]MDG4752876.1 hypothetical protein [Micromonospora sp. WMMD718]RNH92852.1 hypothetical protein EEZ25_33655 [Micromonospora aurantiaca]
MTENILYAQRILTDDSDPDGVEALSALVIAYKVADFVAAVAKDDPDRWTFASLSIAEGIDRLTQDLPGELILPLDASDIDEDAAATISQPLRALLTTLAALYTSAAGRDSEPPWRRLTWSSVAQHIARALQELP